MPLQAQLDEILIAMNRYDCQRALQLLSEAVVEYKPVPESHDLVLARQAALAPDDRKVTSLKVRRITRIAGPTDTAHP